MRGRVTEVQTRGGASRFLSAVWPFWRGATAPLASALTGLVWTFILAGVWVQSLINTWNARFFDALERRDPLLMDLVGVFVIYVAAAGLVLFGTVLSRMSLQVCLRKWLTTRILGHCLERGSLVGNGARGSDTPEFRIADDVRLAVDPLVDLSVGFASSVLIAFTFFAVLARVGGSIHVPLLGMELPAYFLFAAVAYALVMSGLSSLLGWPLVRAIEVKNHREGVFRFELTRLRDPASQGRLTEDTGTVLSSALHAVCQGWRSVVIGHARVSGVAGANAVLVGVFPVMLCIPKYLTGEMTLGAIMQLATAFVQVQMALNWIVDNFFRFAEWRASAKRVGDLLQALESPAAVSFSRNAGQAPATA